VFNVTLENVFDPLPLMVWGDVPLKTAVDGLPELSRLKLPLLIMLLPIVTVRVVPPFPAV
jgi:hypothetical protein